MKDVAILTKFYKNYNYGGMLQGYALHRAITKLGYSVDIISYDVTKNANSVYPSIIVQAKQYGIKAAVTKVGEKAIGKGKYFIRNILSDRIIKFDQFMEDTGANTEIYSDNSMNLLKKHYKTFVSGSDQIWNPNAVRNLYLQTFNAAPDRKISYAASIGRDSFSDFEAAAIIPSIKRFGSIGVREKTAKELLRRYIDKPITVTLDPTMLLSANDWEEISAPRMIEKRYAIVYFFSNSLAVRKASEGFCKKHNLQLVTIPYAKQEYNLTDKKGPGDQYDCVGPNEFVSMIKNADFVLTDSFHGAVFSLIHQVPFAVFERNKSGHVSMNSRLYDLLDIFEENGRLIDVSRIGELDKLFEIDREKIRKILAEWQEKSIFFLKNSIDKGIRAYEHEATMVTVSGFEAECCGCGACVEVCPEECISLKTNENGFHVPMINDEACIQCGKCRRICPIASKGIGNKPVAVYGAYTKKPEKKSASGGLGYSLSRKVIENGGIVYGAAYDKYMQVAIIRVEKNEELWRLQGSKYVQADMTGVISRVIEDLQSGRQVLFTGTPCEVAGVKAMAREKKLEDKLYTTEIICHGTPSPELFKDYLKWAEEKYGKTITSYAFRVKEKDTDKDFMSLLGFSDGSECMVSGFKDPYYKLFLSSRWFRESCYECPFSSKERVADVTIGDYWNSEKLPRNFGRGRRVSVVLVNSDQGKELLDSIREDIILTESNWNVAAAGNVNIYRPTKKNSGYMGYGTVGKSIIVTEEKSGIDLRKYVFNQLPFGFRRVIKRVSVKRG